jgi:hypothetical protein
VGNRRRHPLPHGGEMKLFDVTCVILIVWLLTGMWA